MLFPVGDDKGKNSCQASFIITLLVPGTWYIQYIIFYYNVALLEILLTIFP